MRLLSQLFLNSLRHVVKGSGMRLEWFQGPRFVLRSEAGGQVGIYDSSMVRSSPPYRPSIEIKIRVESPPK